MPREIPHYLRFVRALVAAAPLAVAACAASNPPAAHTAPPRRRGAVDRVPECAATNAVSGQPCDQFNARPVCSSALDEASTEFTACGCTAPGVIRCETFRCREESVDGMPCVRPGAVCGVNDLCECRRAERTGTQAWACRTPMQALGSTNEFNFDTEGPLPPPELA